MTGDAEITPQQAQQANSLVNDAESFAPLIALIRDGAIPAQILAKLREAHDDKTVEMCCNAHCEGLNCCIDILLEDPATYDPARVVEARDLLARWRQRLAAVS